MKLYALSCASVVVLCYVLLGHVWATGILILFIYNIVRDRRNHDEIPR